MTTQMIPLNQITRNPNQPREIFPEEHIKQLANSIKERGLIQPITLRQIAPQRYIIVAGECRFRAHQLLGMEDVRAEIVDIDDREMQLRAIVENLQRADMNAMEEANAFAALIGCGLTKPEIARQLGVGVDRIQNRLNLLDLLPEIQQLVRNGLATSMASAIALAPREHQLRLVRDINRKVLTTVDQVRHAAQAVRDAADQIDAFGEVPKASERDLEIVSKLEQRIEAVAAMVLSGFDEGRCVAAQRVAPDRVRLMTERLSLIRKAILQMEHQLLCVIAQIEIVTMPKRKRSATIPENTKHQTTVGLADRKRTQGR